MASESREKNMEKIPLMYKSYPLTWFWQIRKSPNDCFWPQNTWPLACWEAEVRSPWPRKGLCLPWEGKDAQPGRWEAGETQPACQCHHQPWNQQQPDSLSSHKHLQTTFPSKTLKARGAVEKTENLPVQGKALASRFSRMIAPEKLHYGHSSKVGKGAHLHKGFQQWNLTRSTKSN